MKKILAVLLATLLLLTSMPTMGLVAMAESVGELFETENSATNDQQPEEVIDLTLPTMYATNSTLVLPSGRTLTRAEWLHNLVVVFEMTSETAAMPDNYFSDLTSSHKYYNDILLAVQFGVVNIEAGEELCPDDALTRNFAVSTLNFCLGYQLEEEVEYTFTDYELCADSVSAQIAVNRGWVELIDGCFAPETELTTAEATIMLQKAEEVLAETTVGSLDENSYEFAEDVTVIPEGTLVSEDENGIISITDCPEEISVGEKFAVYFNGIPVVYTALSVTANENTTNISTEALETEQAFTNIQAEGIIESGDMEIIPAEGIEVEIEEESASTYSTRAVKNIKNINVPLSVDLGGGFTAFGNVSINNPYVEYSIDKNYSYVTLNGDTTVNYGIKADLLSGAGLSKTITLFTCNIGGVGSFDIAINLSFNGSATGTVKGFLVAGIACDSDGVRALKSFTQSEYYNNVEATANVGLRATLGVTKLPVISAYIYAEMGANAKLSSTTYASGDPKRCTHFAAYMYAKYGASASVNFFNVYKESFNKNFDVYNYHNSPVRIVHHYEDGVEVPSCTRGTSYSNYFTYAGSRWGGSGWMSANGAYGLNADGTTFKLYNYTLNENNEATITKYNGNSWSVYVPETIDGYTVVGIGSEAFRGKSVGYVSLPNTVTKIGSSVFADCSNLKTVNLSQSLTEIGGQAFRYCSSLKNITLPKSLVTLGAACFLECDSLENMFIPKSLITANADGWGGPFARCDGLKNITFEEKITEIPSNLFSCCYGIEEITIPDTVTKIGSSVFAECSNLKTVNLSQSLTEIGGQAFRYCSSLKNITLPKSLVTLGAACFLECDSLENMFIPKSLINANADGWGGPFARCDGLKNITFEEKITEIPNALFYACYGIEEITIPDTVTKIGSSVFAECSNLKTVNLSQSLTEIGGQAFRYCSSLKNITLPKSLVTLGAACFLECDSLENMFIPKSLINANADGWGGPFARCDGLKNITFEEKITKIPSNLFSCCYGIEEITIPDTVTKIGSSVFAECSNLKTVNLSKNITEIAYATFDKCSSLINIYIPVGVLKIDGYSFCDCASLKTIIIPELVTTIEESAFAGCSSLKSIEIPDSVTSMGRYCFDGCSSIESVKLPNNMQTITEYMFRNCTSLKTIEFPKTVTTIQQYAFYGCTSLESFTFSKGSSLKEIHKSAFENCSSLKEAVLPETTTSIGSYAFKNCVALEKVYIPQSTKTLGAEAFINCESLKDITISDYSIKNIESATFKNCPAIENITLPKGLTTIKSEAFMNGTGLMKVIIPETVTTINSTAFSYPAKTTIYGRIDSYAETFANDGGFKFVDNAIPVEGIILKGDSDYITIDQGETIRVEFELYPEEATDVIYMTSNNNNVTIDGLTIYGRYAGDSVITVTTTSGVPYEFYVHIRSVKNITIASKPTKLEYIIGEQFDASGMQVQVNYNDGSTKLVDDYTVTGFDSSAEGTSTVTIKWVSATGSTYSASFTVDIINPAPKLTGIFVGTLPNKTEYIQREKLDLTGLVILGTYTDGVDREITNYTVSGYNALRKGTQTITVKVTVDGISFTTTFTVTVSAPKTLSNILVNKTPTKTEYKVGEELDTSGMELTLTYSDGSTEVITSGFAISGFDSSTEGEKALTISYNGKTTTFTVNVISNVTPGDVDGDERVNLNDLITMAQYAAGWENIEINEDALDLNGDGSVDLEDVTHLARYLAGWNVVLH